MGRSPRHFLGKTFFEILNFWKLKFSKARIGSLVRRRHFGKSDFSGKWSLRNLFFWNNVGFSWIMTHSTPLHSTPRRVTPEWSQDDPHVIPRWPQSDPKMIPNWPQSGPKMTPGRPQDDPKMTPRWSQDDGCWTMIKFIRITYTNTNKTREAAAPSPRRGATLI